MVAGSSLAPLRTSDTLPLLTRTFAQFWRSKPESEEAGAGDDATVPDEWLEADIKQGISNNDVESRRKRFGYNEISTDKENLFIKFLMFFTGPILYGMSPPASRFISELHRALCARNGCFPACCVAFSTSSTCSLKLRAHGSWHASRTLGQRANNAMQSWKSPFFSLLVCEAGSTSVSSLVF